MKLLLITNSQKAHNQAAPLSLRQKLSVIQKNVLEENLVKQENVLWKEEKHHILLVSEQKGKLTENVIGKKTPTLYCQKYWVTPFYWKVWLL